MHAYKHLLDTLLPHFVQRVHDCLAFFILQIILSGRCYLVNLSSLFELDCLFSKQMFAKLKVQKSNKLISKKG